MLGQVGGGWSQLLPLPHPSFPRGLKSCMGRTQQSLHLSHGTDPGRKRKMRREAGPTQGESLRKKGEAGKTFLSQRARGSHNTLTQRSGKPRPPASCCSFLSQPRTPGRRSAGPPGGDPAVRSSHDLW